MKEIESELNDSLVKDIERTIGDVIYFTNLGKYKQACNLLDALKIFYEHKVEIETTRKRFDELKEAGMEILT